MNKLNTQAGTMAFHKATKGKFHVLSFENGVRYSSYGGLSLAAAMVEIARRTAEGKQILLITEEGSKACTHWEWENRSRVPFKNMVEFAINIKDYL